MTAEVVEPAGRLLRRPGVARLLASSLVGRLPTGMVPVALVLFGRDADAGYGAAGLLAAAYAAGIAVGSPLLARLIDRSGQTGTLVGASVLGSVALALLPPAGPVLGVVAAAVAGLASPPLEPALRALWPTLLPAPDVPRIYALDATAQELVFIAGPLLVLLATAVGGGAGGLFAAAAIGVAGTLWFATAGPSRHWRPVAAVPRHWAGALRPVGLRRIYLALVLAGLTIGTLPVAAAAYAENTGHRGFAAWLVAANAVGALLGGLAFARRAARVPAGRALPWILALLGAGYLPLALLPAAPAALPVAVLLSIVSGVFLPPVLTCTFLVVDRLAPEGTVTEAFAWVITSFVLGSSVGAALAGALVDLPLRTPGALAGPDGSTWPAFVLAGAASLLAAIPARNLIRPT